MKNIDYYMSLPYKMEIIPDETEGGFVVSFPELKGCMTCIDKLSDIEDMAKDAKKSWFEACMEDKIEIPEPKEKESYSGQFKIRMPKELHRELALQAKANNISMNQYCIYKLSRV